MTCRFGTGMKWNEIANWKHFWFVLSLKRQSASSPSPGHTIPHWFWFPISHGTCSLVWKHCWLFATQHTAAQGPFISARTVKTPDLPSTQLQAMTVNFAASQRGCSDLLLFGQTSLRCFLSCIQIWSTSADICRASFPLAWLALTTATKTGLFLTKYPFFFIKTLSSYRAWESPISFMNASERLYPFVTAASLRFLQGLLFCAMINNCSTVFCLNACGCTVSHEQETSYSIATTHWDKASRLGKKRQSFKQPLLQFHIKITSFKVGQQGKNICISKHRQQFPCEAVYAS